MIRIPKIDLHYQLQTCDCSKQEDPCFDCSLILDLLDNKNLLNQAMEWVTSRAEDDCWCEGLDPIHPNHAGETAPCDVCRAKTLIQKVNKQ